MLAHRANRLTTSCRQIRPALRVAARGAPTGGSMPRDHLVPRLNRSTPIERSGPIHPTLRDEASGSDRAAGLADGGTSPSAVDPLRGSTLVAHLRARATTLLSV